MKTRRQHEEQGKRAKKEIEENATKVRNIILKRTEGHHKTKTDKLVIENQGKTDKEKTSVRGKDKDFNKLTELKLTKKGERYRRSYIEEERENKLQEKRQIYDSSENVQKESR